MGFPKQTLLLISQNFDDGVSNELDVLNQRCSKYNVLSVETSKIEHLGNFSKTCSKYLSTTIYLLSRLYIDEFLAGKILESNHEETCKRSSNLSAFDGPNLWHILKQQESHLPLTTLFTGSDGSTETCITKHIDSYIIV